MKNIPDYQQDIASIRHAMERSVKFLSLSGLSGLLAGIYALVGAVAAYYILYYPQAPFGFSFTFADEKTVLIPILGIASIVLLLAIGTAYMLSMRNAKKSGLQFWSAAGKQMLFSLFIPLLSGGLFMLILFSQEYYSLLVATCLIFYGLALVYAGQHTFGEIRYLGFCEITLGLIAALVPEFGLLIWTLGFSLLHLIYGTLMYYRHDK
jgi:hypothetical protein